VESISVRQREYLADKDKMETGYEVSIILRANADDDSKGCRWRYQLLSGGRYIEFQGGGAWSKAAGSSKKTSPG
jgi:hypothetical protein